MRRIAIITTRQNYVWTSMQEVLPALERCWQQTADESRIINVDEEALRNHITFLMSCDALIVIAYNETVARFINAIRKELNIEIPLAFHLYGHATIALWPEHRFHTLELLKSGDAFIGTCQGDIECMNKTFTNARTFDVPYPYFELDKKEIYPQGNNDFAFIGRISDQKNLDVLLLAYAQTLKIKKHNSLLYIYGTEDFLGSPNMGEPSSQCQENLLKLRGDLGLEEKIIFRGFKDRSEIYKELGVNHIFVSASTHSDENFGMAAMRSLYLGAKAVLSNWGGHKNFMKYFGPNVRSTGVYFKKNRPVVDPNEFAEMMISALESPAERMDPDYFKPASVTKQLGDILNQLSSDTEFLKPTPVALKAYEQHALFEKSGMIQKVFKGYDDEVAQVYLQAYL